MILHLERVFFFCFLFFLFLCKLFVNLIMRNGKFKSDMIIIDLQKKYESYKDKYYHYTYSHCKERVAS